MPEIVGALLVGFEPGSGAAAVVPPEQPVNVPVVVHSIRKIIVLFKQCSIPFAFVLFNW